MVTKVGRLNESDTEGVVSPPDTSDNEDVVLLDASDNCDEDDGVLHVVVNASNHEDVVLVDRFDDDVLLDTRADAARSYAEGRPIQENYSAVKEIEELSEESSLGEKEEEEEEMIFSYGSFEESISREQEEEEIIFSYGLFGESTSISSEDEDEDEDKGSYKSSEDKSSTGTITSKGSSYSVVVLEKSDEDVLLDASNDNKDKIDGVLDWFDEDVLSDVADENKDRINVVSDWFDEDVLSDASDENKDKINVILIRSNEDVISEGYNNKKDQIDVVLDRSDVDVLSDALNDNNNRINVVLDGYDEDVLLDASDDNANDSIDDNNVGTNGEVVYDNNQDNIIQYVDLARKRKNGSTDVNDIGSNLKFDGDEKDNIFEHKDDKNKEVGGNSTGYQNVSEETQKETEEDQSPHAQAQTQVQVQQSPSKSYPKWLLDMGRTADWWSLWIGLFSFCLAFAVVHVAPLPLLDDGTEEEVVQYTKYVMPQPQLWSQNPLDAWNVYGIVGTLLLLTVLFLQYFVALKCMGKLGHGNNKMSTLNYAKGFAVMSVLALLAFWVGRNVWCAKSGLGYAVLSILLGMLMANIPFIDLPDWLLHVAKDGEFFIKCSLVLLAVEFSVIGQIGWQSFVVAWIGSPLALIIGFVVGTQFFCMDANLALLVAVGATWCGASAISAVGAVLGSKSSDISTSISVVAFFTVIFTFVQAYIAIGIGMDDRVAGAWIGGSVDQTGNVVASAAIVSEEAASVAAIVKMVLNSGLGILVTVIAFWWQVREQRQEIELVLTEDSENDEEAPITSSGKTPSVNSDNARVKFEQNHFSLLILWDKFPKFILGYMLCSGILTCVIPVMADTKAAAIMGAIGTLNKWWFAIAFIGIGLGTNVKKLWEAAFSSGVIKLYLVANTFDVLLALGLAYAAF